MAVLTIAMFIGLTTLAMVAHVHITDDPTRLIGAPGGYVQRTVIAQLSGAVFGSGSIGFYFVQTVTASILGQDGFLPRQLARRGDRLVFSNGILILAAFAIALLVAFDASPTRLIQLYILGVFVSFTLSQAGMVRHWSAKLRLTRVAEHGTIRRARAINGFGAALTATVLIIVLATKFAHGAWLVVVAMPVL